MVVMFGLVLFLTQYIEQNKEAAAAPYKKPTKYVLERYGNFKITWLKMIQDRKVSLNI